MDKKKGRQSDADARRLILTGILFLLIACFIGIFLGRVKGTNLITFSIRLPRTIAGIFCGAGLSVAGLLLQSSLHNSLCSPGIIGINQGAGVFTLLAGLLCPSLPLVRGLFSFVGALLSVALVFGITGIAGRQRSTVILAGVAVSSLMSALMQGIILFFPEAVVDKISFNLGGLSTISLSQLYPLMAVSMICFVLVCVFATRIEMLTLGDEVATGLGIHAGRTRAQTVVLAGMLSGAVISVAGLLGFIGLIVPNVVRMCHIRNFRIQILLCMLYGGAFLTICDSGARFLFYPYEVPVGLIMSVIGAPFFVFLLMRRKRMGHE